MNSGIPYFCFNWCCAHVPSCCARILVVLTRVYLCSAHVHSCATCVYLCSLVLYLSVQGFSCVYTCCNSGDTLALIFFQYCALHQALTKVNIVEPSKPSCCLPECKDAHKLEDNDKIRQTRKTIIKLEIKCKFISKESIIIVFTISDELSDYHQLSLLKSYERIN